MIEKQSDFRYWAFLSYSRSDDRWAKGIHRRLERYRVPRHLVGHPPPNRAIPKRLYPIFRDREELRTNPNLGHSLDRAIEESRSLVVLCSPASAKSQWVDYEIRRFRELGRTEDIHYLIVGGNTDSESEDFCFPVAAVTTDNQGRHLVPLAADVRPGGDGTQDAVLKIVAGILGLDFDALRRRDAHRRIQRALLVAAFSVALAAVFAVVSFLAVQAQNEATRQAGIATSRSLSASALNERQREDLAILMTLEALRIAPTSEAKASLLEIVATTPIVRYLRGHSRSATALASVPSGKLIFTGGKKGELFVWDGRTYEMIANLSGAHREAISALAASRDGSLFASADLEGIVVIWRTSDPKPVAAIRHGHGAVRALEFGPGRVLASGGDDRHVRLWTENGAEIGGGVYHLGAVSVVTFDPSGERLVTVGKDGSVVLWDTATMNAQRLSRTAHAYEVETAAFSDDGTRLTVAGDEIVIWDVTVDPPSFVDGFETRWGVSSILLDTNGTLAIVGSETGFIDIYNLTTGESLDVRFDQHRGSVHALAVLSELRVVSAASDDVAGAVVWQRPDNQRLPELLSLSAVPQDTGLNAAAFVGDLAITAGRVGNFAVLSPDFENGLVSTLFAAPGDTEIDQIIEVDEGHFLTRRLNGSISIWSIDTATHTISRINSKTVIANAVAVHPSGDFIVTLDSRGVNFLGFPDLERRAATQVDVVLPKRVGFNASGARMAIADRDGLLVWDVASGTSIERLYTPDAPIAFAYAPSGDTVAWSSASNDVVFWNVDGTSSPSRLGGHLETVYGLAFSPDGSLLASTDAVGMVMLWDVARQRQLAKLRLHTDIVDVVDFSNTGEALLTGAVSGAIEVTDLALTSWIASACSMIDRNMTKDEWRRFGSGPYAEHCPDVAPPPRSIVVSPPKPLDAPNPIVVATGYEVVTDATGTISALVPSNWQERDLGPVEGGGLLRSRIRVASSLEEYVGMRGPGLDFAVVELDDPASANLRTLLELVMDSSSQCGRWAGDSRFANESFTGTLTFLRPCGPNEITEVWLAEILPHLLQE